MAGSGNQQIIGGQTYQMYTPAWYAAQKANEVGTASTAGTAAGTEAGSALTALSPSLQGLLSATSGTGSATGGTGSVGVGGAGTAGVLSSATGTPGSGDTSIPGIAPIDMTASNDSTFANAKDQAGETARSEIDSMNGLFGATNALGGGAQAQGTRDIVENAAGAVGDVTRQNAVTTAQSNADIAKTNQAAAITQRGQDIAAQQAQAQLGLEEAQLNSQRQLAILGAALGSIPSGSGLPASTALY